MADAQLSKTLPDSLDEALTELVAALDDCQTLTSDVASHTWGGRPELTLHMVARVLGSSMDKIEELQDMLWREGKGAANDDGTPLGEIIRSAGVAMKNALAFAPSNNRDGILMATANILDQAEQLDPNHEGLSDWSKARELVAGM